MDEANVFAFLKSVSVSYKKPMYSGKWMNISCPLAPYLHAKGSDNSPSFGVLIDPDGKSFVKCLSCNTKGSLSVFASRLGRYRKQDYSKQAHWAEMTELSILTSRPLPEWDEAYDQETVEQIDHIPEQERRHDYAHALAHPYLRKRGIDWHASLRLDLRYDEFQQRILFPVYDDRYRFRGFSGRSTMREEFLNKKNPKVRDYFGLKKQRLFLFNRRMQQTLLQDRGIYGRQILVEGLFGYASTYLDGFVNTNASMGTAVTSEKIEMLIQRNLPLYLFMDNDKAGTDAMLGQRDNETGELDKSTGWAEQLYRHIPVWICQYPEGTEGFDPHDLTAEQRYDAVKNARLYTERYV